MIQQKTIHEIGTMIVIKRYFIFEGYGDHRELHVRTHSFRHDALPIFNAQKYDDALDVLDVALKDQPDDADLLYSRSLVYERMNKIDAAEKDLRTVIANQPNDARSLNALGYMLAVHTQRPNQAGQEERRVGKECVSTVRTRWGP